jgi:hypothetical protein
MPGPVSRTRPSVTVSSKSTGPASGGCCIVTAAIPASSAARSSVRVTHTVPARHPSVLLYRPDTTPATAPSPSRITGAPLIPGSSASAVIRPTGTAPSHIAGPVHWPIVVRDRAVRPGSAITQCPVTVTPARAAI